MSLIWISILVLLSIYVLAKLFVNPNDSVEVETFDWDRYPGKDSVNFYDIPCDHDRWNSLSVGKTALDCYKLSKRDCMKYSNCGLCYKDGQTQCIPGDEQGPFFEDQCQQWQYTDFYDNYIFGEKVTKTVPPWNKVYPDYEMIFPSTIARSTLQSFKEQSQVPNDII